MAVTTLFARPVSARLKTALLTASLAATAVGLSVWSVVRAEPSAVVSQPVMFVALTLAFFLGEQYMIQVEFRRQSHSLTFAGVPLMLGILLLPVHELVVARVVGSLIALLVQRISVEKVLYNCAAFGFEAALSSTLLHLWLPMSGGDLTLADVGLLLGVVTLGDQLMSLCVLGVIRMHTGPLSRPDVVEVLVPAFLLSVVTGTLGIAMRLLMLDGVLGYVLVAVLAGIVTAIYAAYAASSRRHHSLRTVHDFVAAGVGAESMTDLGRTSLQRVRAVLRASVAELVIATSPDDRGHGDTHDHSDLMWVRIDEDDEVSIEWAPLNASDWVRSKALHHGEATLAVRGSKDRAVDKWLGVVGVDDAIVVPLAVGTESLGSLTVLDRLGDTTAFTEDDLALLQTLASHLAVAIRGARLVERLGYDATHDPLTGLANRAHLADCIDTLSDDAAQSVAVLLLDLDKFKEVNDVLGHEIGDRLLCVVADRLRACMPDSATIARLGGDEFAVLLTDLGPDALSAATSSAHRAALELVQPARLDEATLTPVGCIGIAIGTHAGRHDLLRQADTAMYAAKAHDEPVALYSAEMDRGRAERLALIADLRMAFNADPHEQFMVCYQPKIDVRTGAVISAEALLRWNHPTLGVVPPDQFIPLAETTGLIDQLTAHVLATALADCARWQHDGHPISVAVNLSARNVIDSRLPDLVTALLARYGLDATQLILEITESSIIEDQDRAVPVLQRLSNAGVCISLDDFGTGYSSLSYLQKLPVSEVKIDKSFVAGLGGSNSEHASALVRSITALAGNLNLRVVAEGIETPDQLDQVTAFGAQIGQGYLISRPLRAPDFDHWLDQRRTGTLRLVTV